MFHVNPLAEDSHEISSLIFSERKRKIYSRQSSTVAVIGALSLKTLGGVDVSISRLLKRTALT